MKSQEFALKTEVFAFTSRSKAIAKPRRCTSVCSSASTVPLGERCWTDIEPGAYSNIAFPVSKRLSALLRHGDLLREEDGVIEFWRLKDCLRYENENSRHWSDEMWKFSISELFKAIQDAIPLIFHYRTMCKFRTISSSTFITYDVQSIYTP